MILELERRFFAVNDAGINEFEWVLSQLGFNAERQKLIDSVELQIDDIQVIDESTNSGPQL